MAGQRDIKSFSEFWPYYVAAHSRLLTRLFHLAATVSTWILVGVAWTTHHWALLILIPFVAYGIAWFSHFFIERNRPATFGHPFYSLAADYKMAALMLVGKMEVPNDLNVEQVL